MINTITSMKTPRWGTLVDFQPNTYTPQMLSKTLEEHKGKYLWCECVSAQHLNSLTKLYFDRDVEKTMFFKEEIEDIMNFVAKKLRNIW